MVDKIIWLLWSFPLERRRDQQISGDLEPLYQNVRYSALDEEYSG